MIRIKQAKQNRQNAAKKQKLCTRGESAKKKYFQSGFKKRE